MRSERRGGGSFRWAKTTESSLSRSKGRAPAEALEEDAAERVDVGAAVDVAALDLLGRDVVDGADEASVGRQAAGRRKVSGESEIADVGVLSGRGVGDEDVSRLHVPMDETQRVRGVESLRDLRHEIERAFGVEASLVPEDLAKVRPFDVGHGEEENAVLLARVEDWDDVGMVE